MMRYRRDDIIRWLIEQGCDADDEPMLFGIAFFTPDGHPFVIPDPDNDGWLPADLVEDVLRDRWVGTSTGRPPTCP